MPFSSLSNLFNLKTFVFSFSFYSREKCSNGGVITVTSNLLSFQIVTIVLTLYISIYTPIKIIYMPIVI